MKVDLEWLTSAELCVWLKITRGTAWKWRKRGMPFVGKGKGIRYSKFEVEGWLREQSVSTHLVETHLKI